MTRTHKGNDRDHQGIADGTAAPQQFLPKYFAKAGYAGEDPKKTKKNGGGRGNWGNPGEEVVDESFTFTKDRRRSNSTGYANNLSDFKTKFDINEQEPVFEESVHGPEMDDDDGDDLAKTETSDSGRSSAVDDDKVSK